MAAAGGGDRTAECDAKQEQRMTKHDIYDIVEIIAVILWLALVAGAVVLVRAAEAVRP
jgi:hypothetical protein